jgi:hypothetical protein
MMIITRTIPVEAAQYEKVTLCCPECGCHWTGKGLSGFRVEYSHYYQCYQCLDCGWRSNFRSNI